MKNKLLILLLLSPFFVHAQINKHPKPDSAVYYQGKMDLLRRMALDSLEKSATYLQTQEQYKRHKMNLYKDRYAGWVYLLDVDHTDYGKFNNSITQNGFEPMNSLTPRLGFGISSQNKRRILDFYFYVYGEGNISHNITNPDNSITSGFYNALQFDWGYSLLHTGTISLYPYVGISIFGATLSYTSTVQTNAVYTNITNIVANNQSVHSSSEGFLGYQAGIGLDIKVKSDKERENKAVLFIKAGTNAGLWADTYPINNIKYNPGIKHGDWQITIGIKSLRRGPKSLLPPRWRR